MSILLAKDSWGLIFQFILHQDLYNISRTCIATSTLASERLKILKTLYYSAKQVVSLLSQKYRVICHQYNYGEKVEPIHAKYMLAFDKTKQGFSLNAIAELGCMLLAPDPHQCVITLKLGKTVEKIADAERNSLLTWLAPALCNLKLEYNKPVENFHLTFPSGHESFSILEQNVIQHAIDRIKRVNQPVK